MIAFEDEAAREISERARPLAHEPWDVGPVMELIGDARIVLMGEATHGTHEFYEFRAELSKRLIEERGFSALAVEADWPDAYRVNRYVRGVGRDERAIDALGDFRRFPVWMWRNTEVLDLVGWLRELNEGRARRDRVGFYGLDLYSLYSSIAAVVGYLERVDPDAAARARHRYSCFEGYGAEPRLYGRAAALGLSETCEREAVEQLVELREKAAEYLRNDGMAAEDELFFAQQNAAVAADAERYYRMMFAGRASSWNLRDEHMGATLGALVGHMGRLGGPAKVIVWAHNSHLGDARATEMGEEGELNLGQLARQRYGDRCFALGFSTYHGTVSAAEDWDGPVHRMRVRPGLRESWEEAFHRTGMGRLVLPLRGAGLRQRLLQRAIGVIYRAGTERQSHYLRARLADQFDAVVHIDHTRALEPLDMTSEWSRAEAPETPETYPSGL